MTLNSNKNEPAVILERVNSARTALSDLYLEQLLQNKPKSDKAAMQAYDCKGQEVFSNGSAGHMNGKDSSRMREVAFEKNPSEPLGVTLKLNERQRCTVARILHGGMIHKQGSLHEGDEIAEINGKSVANQSVDQLQKILKDTNGVVTLKIIPNQQSRVHWNVYPTMTTSASAHNGKRKNNPFIKYRSHRSTTMILIFENAQLIRSAPGVGRSHIKNSLLSKYPEKFAYPAPHTTRPQKKDEENGKEYYFISNDEMTKCIIGNELLEYGSYQGHMFGTKIETVHKIHEQGKIAVLDVEPQTLKVLRMAEFAPLVMFIAPTNTANQSEAVQNIQKESDSILSAYRHFFDEMLVNNDVDESVKGVEEAIERASSTPQWVPISWVY
uniref:Membrane protein, palmitoylated 1 n=1 Tax=Cyprinus carpio TaxID=7962 RepID=A0A8C2GXM5_CYPCA